MPTPTSAQLSAAFIAGKKAVYALITAKIGAWAVDDITDDEIRAVANPIVTAVLNATSKTTSKGT